MMTNVIDLSKAREKLNKLKQVDTESEEPKFDIDDLVIDLSLDCTITIIESLQEFGFDAEDPNCAQDIVLVVEALKGLMYRCNNTKFPTQELSRIIFTINDPEKFVDEFFNN
jgi:hypothetical protein